MNKTIYIIGGTTEAGHAAARLQADGYHAVISVATALGERAAAATALGERAAAGFGAGAAPGGPEGNSAGGLRLDPGRKTAAEMAAAVKRTGAAAILDCSHPYAVAATAEARQAAGIAAVPYLRYARPPVEAPAAECFRDAASAARRLAETGGRALLTIGVRNLEPFISAGAGFAVRILPVVESLEACLELGIAPPDIIAAQPPFDVDFNRACLRRAAARFLVTKDSGAEGGLPEKLAAAAAEDVRVLMLKRPPEPDGAYYDLESVMNRLAAVSG